MAKYIRKITRQSADSKPKACVACAGSGHYDAKNSPPCSACGGTGQEER